MERLRERICYFIASKFSCKSTHPRPKKQIVVAGMKIISSIISQLIAFLILIYASIKSKRLYQVSAHINTQGKEYSSYNLKEVRKGGGVGVGWGSVCVCVCVWGGG